MCEDKRNFINDDDEWTIACGVRVPKKQLQEALDSLDDLVEKTEKKFDIKDLCRRKK